MTSFLNAEDLDQTKLSSLADYAVKKIFIAHHQTIKFAKYGKKMTSFLNDAVLESKKDVIFCCRE